MMPLSGQLLAQEATPREATISVSGEGQAAIAPDMAILSFSVVKQAETAAAALSENSKALADVLKALGTGIYVSNLWYLNFSDRSAGRLIVQNLRYDGPAKRRAPFDRSLKKALNAFARFNGVAPPSVV